MSKASCLSRFAISALVAFSATPAVSAQQKAPNAASTQSGKFVDIAPASGIKFQYQSSHTEKKYLLETMGPGVALFDYDNDGRLDIFVVNGAPLADPMAKNAMPKKNWPGLLESPLPSEIRRHI